MVHVRDAREADVEQIADVQIKSWQVAYAGQLPDELLAAQSGRRAERMEQTARAIAAGSPQRRVLVAEHDGRVVGFASFGPSRKEGPNVGELYAIYLDPDAWGKGIGRALFAESMTFLAKAGFAEAMLWVLRSNDRARRFYEAAGWETDGTTQTENMRGVLLEEVKYRWRGTASTLETGDRSRAQGTTSGESRS